MPSLITGMPGSAMSSPLSGGTPDTASHVADFNAALGQSPSATTSNVDTATKLTGTATADIASLIKQLIPLLEQLAAQLSGGPGAQGGAPAGEGAGGSAPTKNTPPASAAPGGKGPAEAAGSDDLNTLIPQLISALQQALGEKAEGPKTEGPKAEGPKAEGPKAEGPKAEGPKTEGPKTEAPADGASQGANTQLASLIKQLITLLQQILGGGSPSQAGGPDAAKTISMVKDLIAQLQTQGAGGPGSSLPAPAQQPAGSPNVQQTRSDPSLGITLAQVQAMLNHVNGTGPEVIYADWGPAPSTQPSAAGGQVSGLGSQVGNEAA